MALWQKDHAGPVIFYSDRGSQFTSYEYQRFLSDHNVISSMSAVGSCYDNAAAETKGSELIGKIIEPAQRLELMSLITLNDSTTRGKSVN